MPNESEAMKITGVEDTRAAIAVLSALCPILVVKAGSNGAYAAACGRVLHSPARPVHAAETTGAGDCFNAGFIAAWLEGRSIEGCLARGNECAGQWVAGRNIT
jgi:sugar/nucleoside kinase (ribokinase family)